MTDSGNTDTPTPPAACEVLPNGSILHRYGCNFGPDCPAPASRYRKRKRRVRLIFAWYDLWIGVFIDRPKHRLYIFPLPCIGVVIEWQAPDV